ncbi:MAG TPA: hypothetical protein VG167_02930 [Verrucomicrobiae bacterium]|nr:hypothetical protein [Verrucomicrobiae bacterium]
MRACLASLFGQQVGDWSNPQSVFELPPMVPTTNPTQTNVLVKYYEPSTHFWGVSSVAPDTCPPWFERKIRYRQLGSADWTVLGSYIDARFNEPIAAPGWEAQGAYYDSRAPAHYASPWSRSHIILPA